MSFLNIMQDISILTLTTRNIIHINLNKINIQS